jgi:predicted O-methyltransferase YrrM
MGDLTSYLIENLNKKEIENFEGNISSCAQQYLDLVKLTNDPNINVMEIGFNGGHSAELFLKNNDKLSLTSFDIGEHPYVLIGKAYIDKIYPNRHTLIIGDSKMCVPNFYKNYKGIKFDFIFIDGGHDYETARRDLENCYHLAHKDTIVAIDDTMFSQYWLKWWNVGPTKAWMELLEKNKIIELNRTDYSDGKGMCYGKYVM